MTCWILSLLFSSPSLAGLWIQGLRTLPSHPLEERLLRVFGGKPLQDQTLNAIRDSLRLSCFDYGFPLAQVKIQGVIERPDSFWLVLRVEEGPPGLIRSIQFQGLTQANPAFVRTLIPSPQGLLTRRHLREIQEALESTGFLHILGYQIEGGKDGLDLSLQIEERTHTLVNGGLSYGASGIQGDFSLELVNPFGRGRQFSLHYRRLRLSDQTVSVKILDPYFSPWRFLVDLRFRHEFRQPYLLRDRWDLRAGKRLRRWMGAIGLGYERGTDLLTHTQERQILGLLALYVPLLSLDAELGRGLLRVRGRFHVERRFHYVWSSLTLQGFFASDTGAFNRFPIGGATTLRGYPEDLFWVTRALVLTLEIGSPPAWASPYLFLDHGFIFGTERHPTGFGLGFRRRTSELILDLALGIPWEGGLRSARLHLSLKGSFSNLTKKPLA